MEITRATEYAVRCILHLALEPPERVVPRREIAAAREIPEQFLGKIAQRLARAGIIRILQGARGGYQLALSADKVTLLAVVEAAEGDLLLNSCVMHAKACNRTCICAAHRVWVAARRQLRATLGGVSFAELAAQEGSLPQFELTVPAKPGTIVRRSGEAERGPPGQDSPPAAATEGAGQRKGRKRSTIGGR